jgi:hypothetical protein
MTTTDGLPDADALATLGGFDDAYRAASELGEVQLDFEVLRADIVEARGDYRVAVQLSPTDLRNTPSNQLNDVLLGSTSWQSTLRFADAISPEDRLTATFSLYSNQTYAHLVTFDCALSIATSQTPFGAELWQYWRGATVDAGCA